MMLIEDLKKNLEEKRNILIKVQEEVSDIKKKLAVAIGEFMIAQILYENEKEK